MAAQEYSYKLLLLRPGAFFGDKVLATGSWYFDLGDDGKTTAALDGLIGKHGRDDVSRSGYRLELRDPVTGTRVRNITPLGTAPVQVTVANGTVSPLEHVTDEELIAELARRLRTRR